ncbi:hypothetical protein AVEN_145496-1 [Araneus ventricosus]|uniref:Uncharacterized protein n=1 Tax=Araneus ventricosus TaxID=182803 RepID=A0A4Y2JID2_ARAVE|nr:hypothetical protein AVEN_145496-1 [Araneus ventricosus]
MSSCRISKQELTSRGGTIKVGGVVSPPSSDSTYLLREGSGRGQVNGYQDSGPSTRAVVTATVIQYPGCFGVARVTPFMGLPPARRAKEF